jgi:hypothetical protein
LSIEDLEREAGRLARNILMKRSEIERFTKEASLDEALLFRYEQRITMLKQTQEPAEMREE